MNFVRAQLARIQQQLGDLSASQKMLTGTLVAIMLATLLWWAKYAGEPEMKPVLDQALSTEDQGRITGVLAAHGITYTIQNSRVMVPADRQAEALVELSYGEALPQDTSKGLDDILSKMNAFDPTSKTDKLWAELKRNLLADTISRWKGVKSATVMIDMPDHRSFTEDNQPTATVNIETRDGQAPPKLAMAAAKWVAASTAGLKPSNVSVIIDSMPVQIPDANGDQFVGSTDLLELKRSYEKNYKEVIREHLAFIHGGVMVSVAVSVDTKSTKEVVHTVDPKSTVQVPIETSEQHDDSTSPSQAQGEPGAAPNTGVTLAGAGGGAASGNTSSTETNKYKGDNTYTDKEIHSPAGDPTIVSAVVSVPTSYFAEIYKSRHPGAKDPDDAALQPIATAEMQNIKEIVKKALGLSSDDVVSVTPYTEVGPILALASEEKSTTGTAVVSVTAHAKEIAVGVLAVVSLFMVSSMARKSVPPPVIPIMEEPKEPEDLNVGDEIAGEVGSGETTLDGMELDEDSVKTQQMLDQVSTMVEENPDGAANLVKRWLNRT